MTNQVIDYKQLAAAMVSEAAAANGGVRQKAVGSTPTATYGHGRGGLFSTPGLSRPLFSAMTLPKQGLADILPVRGTNETDPLFGIITGVTATTGDEPTGVCDDAPVVGLTKLCMHTFVLGRFSRQTKVYDLDRIGKVINRSDNTDFQWFGDPFRADGGMGVPTVAGVSGVGQAANYEVAKAMFEFGVAWSRDFARKTYTGNPTNNTADGGYKEFYGLDTLINTGYRDALTGVACPAADSLIRTFGGANVSGNETALVREITFIVRNLKFLARKAGLDPVNFAIAMTFGMFYALTDLWPCSYLSYRCNVSSGSTQFISSGESERMRDEMRADLYGYTGQYLLIDGQRIPVVIDDSITESQPVAGTFESDIYFVPLTVMGGMPVTYWEYINYDHPGAPGSAMEAANVFAPPGTFYTSDNGRFFFTRKPPTNWCVQIQAKTEPRLLLLTPYLAARLTDVRYTPLNHQVEWEPGTSFYVNGGGTSTDQYVPSYFSPTA